jgi:hypothetical protein
MLTALPVIVGSEWVTGVLDNRQTMIATEALGPQELHPRGAFRKNLQLLDLVFQPPNLRLVHLHGAQFHGVALSDVADDFDDPLAIFNRSVSQLFEGDPRRADGFIDAGENSVSPLKLMQARGSRSDRRPRGLRPHFLKDLSDHRSNDIFRNIHNATTMGWMG